MGPAALGGKGGRLEAELDGHPQQVEIGEMHHLAVEIGAPVAVDHDRQEQPRDQEEIRHPERFGEGDQDVHEAGLAGGGFHAQHRMHHHHHDDADALGVVDPVDAHGAEGADSAGRPAARERSATADVPFGVIGVPFRRGLAASSGAKVSIALSPSRNVPFSRRCDPPGRLLGRVFLVMGKCSKTRANAWLRRASRFVALTMTIWIFHAHCHDRHRLCGTGFRRLFRGFRPPGHLRRQGRRQDRQPAPRRDPDFRARARCAGRRQCEGRPAGFHHRSRRAGRRGRCGVHRGRHAVAARRRPRRPDAMFIPPRARSPRRFPALRWW